jgi:beta-phosphoglucomutase-like phosphatase (HAD superfamily)
MRVKGSSPPQNAFSVEEQPKHPGYVLVRFYENPEPYTQEGIDDQETITGWEYDEYKLEMLDTATIMEDILNAFDSLLQQAKDAEIDSQVFNPRENAEQVAQLTQQRADIDYIAVMAGVDLE